MLVDAMQVLGRLANEDSYAGPLYIIKRACRLSQSASMNVAVVQFMEGGNLKRGVHAREA